MRLRSRTRTSHKPGETIPSVPAGGSASRTRWASCSSTTTTPGRASRPCPTRRPTAATARAPSRPRRSCCASTSQREQHRAPRRRHLAMVITNWKDPAHKDPTRISLTVPGVLDRFRLGYSYRLSWGGTPEYKRSKSSTPGVKPSTTRRTCTRSSGPRAPRSSIRRWRGEGARGLAGAGYDPLPNVRTSSMAACSIVLLQRFPGRPGRAGALYGASAQVSSRGSRSGRRSTTSLGTAIRN